MLIRLPEINVIETKPYANDRLGRKPFGDALVNLLTNAQGEFTLAIDGQWGDGKTTFAKMWREHLQRKGFRAIYFDAFSNDHGQDPFAPLSAVLLDAIRPENDAANKEIKEKYVSMGIKLLQIGGRIGIRAATGGLINENDLSEIKETLKGNDADKAISAISQKFAEYQISESELNEFRSLLGELSTSIDSELPLVIILDELDRCRPTFALSLLEKVKHFFSVPGIVFVFVMNSEQICACIEHVYGSSIDARQYLHKFFDVECTLPTKRGTHRNPSLYNVYTKHLIDGYALNDHDDCEAFLVGLAETFDLSLRDMEKVGRAVLVSYTALGDRNNPVSALLYLLTVLKVCDKPAYNALANNTPGAANAILSRLDGSNELNYIRSWLLACTGRDEEVEDDFKQHFIRKVQLWRSRREIIPYYCAVMDYFG